jgi:hypothetical protein
MFHNDHGDAAQQIIVILLGEETPSLSMLAILEDGRYVGRIRYLRGSILNDKDLERAGLGLRVTPVGTDFGHDVYRVGFRS